MSVDLFGDDLLTPSQAAKLLPRGDGGGRINATTVWRWMNNGVRGIVLQSILVGNRRFTSKRALQAFVEQLAGTGQVARQSVPTSRQQEARRRRNHAALQEAGLI